MTLADLGIGFRRRVWYYDGCLDGGLVQHQGSVAEGEGRGTITQSGLEGEQTYERERGVKEFCVCVCVCVSKCVY